MNTPSKQSTGNSALMGFFAAGSMIIAFIAGYLIYRFILGDPINFEGGDPLKGHPKPGNILGIMYKGGFIVPILIGLLITLVLIIIERFIALASAGGKGNTTSFIRRVRELLAAHKIDEAIASCDKQKGSLANVVKAGLGRYKFAANDKDLTRDEKVIAIQKELEEATGLELPMLSKNLVIVSTMASIGVLVGLIGTVFGMIRAFSALANTGAPDTAALATGISEALVNTALGIVTSTFSVIAYNYFSNRIDSMTYSMDEAGYSIVSDFQAHHG
jgi:biopolymer transport protein ExbB